MLDPLSKLGYVLPPLISAIVSIILASVVLLKARRSPQRVPFASMAYTLGLWNIFIFLMRASTDVSSALVWARFGAVFFAGTFVAYYHFTIIYTENQAQRIPLFFAYLSLLIMALLSPTNLVVSGLREASYGYAPVVGTVGIVFSIVTFSLILGCAYILIARSRIISSYEEKNRIYYLLIGIFFPLTGALLDGFTNLPPMSVWFNIIFCSICTIAIVRYHLLDIDIIIRKSLAYLTISVAVSFPYILMLFILDRVFSGRSFNWGFAIVLLLLFSLLMVPLYSMVRNVIDRLFFRDRYNYLKSMQQFSHELNSVANLEELAKTLTAMVSNTMRTPDVGLFLASDVEKNFQMVAWTGATVPEQAGNFIQEDGLLIRHLSESREPQEVETLQYSPEMLGLTSREKNGLTSLKARLLVPIISKPGVLTGILVLGLKKSEQPYSGEDKDLLIGLASNMAMAIENASLYRDSLQELAQRRLVEESLRESEEKYRALIENATDIIFMIGRDFEVLSVNKAAASFLGKTPETCTGMTIFDIFPAEVASNYTQGIKGVFVTGMPLAKTTTDIIFDIEITLDTVLSPIRNALNEVIAVIGVSRDVSERRRAEERERALSQQLTIANRLATIGEMAAGIAHEINNPLTAVIGFSDLLAEQKNLSDDMRNSISIINNGAQRVSDIVKGLLMFSRQQKPERIATDINSILMTTLQLRMYSLKVNKIEVETDFDQTLPMIMADAGQLQQVFLNIIMNAESAVLSAQKNGHLRIKTEKRGGMVCISFADDGVGISEANMQKLFHPFFTTKEVGQGTGLGLSICHGIVIEHKGSIYAKSRLGVGTTFFVELPIITPG